MEAKWCEHCRKDDHNHAECWSTRALPPIDWERMAMALVSPSIRAPEGMTREGIRDFIAKLGRDGMNGGGSAC